MIEKPQGPPVGYTTRPVARRAIRPLHRREAIKAAAESVFTKPVEKPIECPTKN